LSGDKHAVRLFGLDRHSEHWSDRREREPRRSVEDLFDTLGEIKGVSILKNNRPEP